MLIKAVDTKLLILIVQIVIVLCNKERVNIFRNGVVSGDTVEAA